ncbi:unnamed protein product [Larinioides sclopetarius]|uniref:Uncharacterized protein n=1 Tax=Larinioides sclopetarius TaxID=280406 RepID=A0AAV1Z2W8_9ARAC
MWKVKALQSLYSTLYKQEI